MSQKTIWFIYSFAEGEEYLHKILFKKESIEGVRIGEKIDKNGKKFYTFVFSKNISKKNRKISLVLKTDLKNEYESKELTLSKKNNCFCFQITFNNNYYYYFYSQPPNYYKFNYLEEIEIFNEFFKKYGSSEELKKDFFETLTELKFEDLSIFYWIFTQCLDKYSKTPRYLLTLLQKNRGEKKNL